MTKSTPIVAKKTANIDPIHARVIADCNAFKKPQSLSDYYRSWNERANAMSDDTPSKGPVRAPKIDPKDLGATLGPVMSEAQFMEYRRNQAIPRVAEVYTKYHSIPKKDGADDHE